MFRHINHISWLIANIYCLIFPISVFGQLIENRSINQLDLSQFAVHPNIVKIEQDNLGFIWMASDQGLYRMDGKHVNHFTKSDYPELPSNHINSILVNYDGKLWIASQDGLVIMDPESYAFESFELYPGDTSNLNLSSSHLFLASDSTIWIGLNNGIARISPEGSYQRINFDVESYLIDDCFEVMRVIENEDGDIFVQASCAFRVIFIHVNKKGDRPIAKSIYQAEIGTAQMFSKEGEIFLADRTAFYKFDPELITFKKFKAKSVFNLSRPWAIEEIEEATFLVGDKYGILNRFTFTSDTIFSEYIGRVADAGIQDILKDRSGCIWLGTDDGAYYYADRNPQFSSHLSKTITDGRYGLKTRAMVEDQNGLIYVGTDHGLHQFDPSPYKSDLISRWAIALPYSLCAGSSDFLWVGSDGYGLRKFDTRENYFYDRLIATTHNDQLGGLWIGELVWDSDSTLWVGTNNGISYKPKNREQFYISLDFNGKRILLNTFVHDIKEVRSGQYLFGTNRGLYHITRVGELENPYFIVNKYEDVPYKIREICLTAGSDIWLATEDAGLVHYHPTTKNATIFNMSNGLPSDVLYSMLPGPKGELWIGTFEGLARFDTTTYLISNFFEIDGLPHNEFNSQSQLIARDGTFYMGTQNGIVSFNPAQFGIDSSSLPVMVNSLLVHNTRIDSTFVESRFSKLTERVNIGPHDNLVTISYSIADYTKPEGNRFQYWLEGLYEDWHYVGNQTELVLPHLPAGDYTLWIKGAGSDGRWSTKQAVVPITVRAMYYNTWWFRLSILAAIIAIMWLIHWYRLNQVLKLQRIRLRISEDLHDELGSALTGISIQTQLMTRTETSSGRAGKLKEISSHIQDSVSKLGDIVWSLQSGSGSLDKLMDRIEEQTHLMLDPGKMECKFMLSREAVDLQLREEVMQNCFLIFKEALTNIVKHSNADKVEIEVSRLQNELFLSVSDNGQLPSLAKSLNGGNGLKNMNRRAEKMHGELKIHQNGGYRIELRVPKAYVS